MKSLTRTEATERAALLAVQRYDITLDLSDLPTGPAVRTTSRITFTCRTPGAHTFADAAATVLRATLNGRDLGPAVQGRLLLEDLHADNVLVVECEQTDTTHGPGVHKAVDPADGEVYLWTSFEPDQARHVWACFDQPDLKAPHAFTVTAPAGWTVTSNAGAATTTSTIAGNRTCVVWTFPATVPLSPYNTVVNAGPFHQIRREVGGHDLGLYARRSLAAVLERDAEQLFTVTAQGLAFFGEQFGMPFPQTRYDQVFVPEFGGAMENFGCVTWSDSHLRRHPPTAGEQELQALILLHEMAHMWFGNIVTMRWWDDLWLNESFAEFAAHWAATEASAHTGVWARHLVEGKLEAYLADQGPVSHPIHRPVHDVDQAMSIFDAITYPKGASALRQLQVYVGEKAFRTGMSSYFAHFAWGSTTLQDLVDELAAASGKNLKAWRQGWLETAGTDRFTLESTGDRLVLMGSGPAGPPRPQLLSVGAYRLVGDALVRTDRHLVEVQSGRTPVNLPPGADLYLVNDDDLTFASTRPPVPATVAGQLPTTLARAVATASIWDALLTGEAGARTSMNGLLAVLRAETAPTVGETYLNLAASVVELWSPAGERDALAADLAELCRSLTGRPDLRRAALRILARVTTDVEELVTDDLDLRWRGLIRRSELGEDTSAAVAELLALDPDPDAGARAVAVRAAAPSAEAKAQAWQAVVERTLPLSATFSVMNAFWRPGQDELLHGYGEKYLSLLPTMHTGGMIPGLYFTEALFPVVGVDETFVGRVMTATEGDLAPVVATTLAGRADLLARMLRARGGSRI